MNKVKRIMMGLSVAAVIAMGGMVACLPPDPILDNISAAQPLCEAAAIKMYKEKGTWWNEPRRVDKRRTLDADRSSVLPDGRIDYHGVVLVENVEFGYGCSYDPATERIRVRTK